MVQKVNDGASEWKLIIAKIPLLSCACLPAAVPSAWTSVLTAAPCPPSVSAPCCPTGLPGSESCPPCLILTPPPVFSHSWSVFQCFCTFNLHACFGKTSTPEKITSGRALPSMRWSILFLLQEWPIFWTLFSATHFLQRFVLNSPEGDPHLFRWFTVPTQSQLENFHNMSCFWHWCYILVANWCWSWSCNTLNTWYEELIHWKRPWCWERLKANNRGWDGWMALPTQWTWKWQWSRSIMSDSLPSHGL